MSQTNTISLTLILFLIQILASITNAVVPESATFKYVNEGEFGSYISEYNPDYRTLSIFTRPFQLCFYNTTPNTYYLGLRVGLVRSTSLMRWVYDFNRLNPVKENATFSLGTDGNLVLAEANGHVAWQSGTANKGVVGFELLSTGNMVLYDAKGKFLWQSFDYPTDTLLVEQHFRVGSKLISRTSPEQNTNGPYSFSLEPKRLAMYYQPKNSVNKQLYYELPGWSQYGSGSNGSSEYMKLDVNIDNEISLQMKVVTSPDEFGVLGAKRLRYNATVTYLRVGIDGSLKTFTYDQDVDIQAWSLTLDLFSGTSSTDVGACQLPEKCGKFGVCDKGQCVACPSPNGLLGWSEKCKPPKLSASSCDVKKVKYYKIVGVDHFLTKYNKGDGPMKEGDCSKKCTLDCKCAGYFYQQDKSLCWVVSDLMTLTKVADKKHLGYIKI